MTTLERERTDTSFFNHKARQIDALDFRDWAFVLAIIIGADETRQGMV